MSNEDMLMNPSSSFQVPTPATVVNTFNQLEMLNHYMGNNDVCGGSTIAARDASYRLMNNASQPAPCHASHDHPHLAVFAPYGSLTNHVEASLSEPINQLPYDHNCFPQCAYNYSSNDQVDAYSNSLQPYYAHDIAGLGSSHEETITAQLGSCGQLEVVGMSMPFGTCVETSQSAYQSNDQKPQWGNMYSSVNAGGIRVSGDTFGGSRRPAHEGLTVLSTSPAAGSLVDHNLGAKDELEHRVALIGDQTESRRQIELTNPALAAYQELAFTHNEIPKHDQRDKMVGLSTGLTSISPASGTNYEDSGYIDSADKADHRMQQEGARSKEHMYAERKRRRKQGDCIDTLRTLVPILPKKKDKVTVLKSTIEYITKLKGLVSKLEKDKVALGNMNYANSKGEMDSCCCSEHVNIIINSSQNTSSETTATCEFIPSSSSREIMPHFELNLATSIKTVNVNVPIIEIISALGNVNLHCIDFKLKFLENTSNLGATILAKYKDGESYTPNTDEIQNIKQWWTHLVIDQLSAKWKL